MTVTHVVSSGEDNECPPPPYAPSSRFSCLEDHVRPQTFDVLFGQVSHHGVGGEYPLDRCVHQKSPNNREYGRVDLKFHIGTRRIYETGRRR
jgi:hypothetical protein